MKQKTNWTEFGYLLVEIVCATIFVAVFVWAAFSTIGTTHVV